MTGKTQIIACPTEQLILYRYGELHGDDSLQIENHLQQCPACRAELSSLTEILDQVPIATPELTAQDLNNFNARVMKQLPQRNRFGRAALGWTFAGAVVILLSFNLQQQKELPVPKLLNTPVQMTADQEVLNQIEFLQNLDLLENLDLLQQLDRLG
jgi:anti-sigma factor RsiW